MEEDFQKFMELVKTDEALQKKLEKAGKNYDGEKTEEVVFHAVLEPIAKEAGFSLSLDDMKQSVQELNLDEMSQVAGGGGYGTAWGHCIVLGMGIGVGGGHDEERDTYGGHACVFVGLGYGYSGCFGSGEVEAQGVAFTGNLASGIHMGSGGEDD